MNPTITVTDVEVLQGDEMRSCSTCGEVEHVVWTIQVNQHHPEKRCTRHASFDVQDTAMGQQFAASVVSAKVRDDSLASDLIYGVEDMLENVRRLDLSAALADAWDPSTIAAGAPRMRRARFLIGSVAFALLPSVPVEGDDDHSEGDTFSAVARG